MGPTLRVEVNNPKRCRSEQKFPLIAQSLCEYTQMLNWDDLRFFVELARSGSLSLAARRLQTEHSTVARRITALEQALGLKLFDRMPRGYVLTPEGERLAERSGAVEAAVFAVQRLADGDAAAKGRVRISAPPAFAGLWLMPRLASFHERHPDLVLDVAGETGVANLIRREADLALRLSRPPNSALIARKLGKLRYGLYGSRDYLERTSEDHRAFLAYDQELDEVPQQQWLRRIAAGRPIALLSNDLVAIISGVRAGMGLAAIPHILVENDRDLVSVAEDPGAARELWLLLHPDLRRSQRVRLVIDHLVAVTETLR
jgi:DNA-binding transcriptional LysR family regulator